jgi:hypothetical protein
MIWGAAIIASAILLRGEGHVNMIVVILAGVAGAGIIIVSNALIQDNIL